MSHDKEIFKSVLNIWSLVHLPSFEKGFEFSR